MLKIVSCARYPRFLRTLGLGAALCIALPYPAFAMYAGSSCSFASAASWNGGSGVWTDAGMWSSYPAPYGDVCITEPSSSVSQVNNFTQYNVGNLQIGAGNSLTLTPAVTTNITKALFNDGSLVVSAGANDAYLTVSGTVEFNGGGTVTLNTNPGPGAARIRGADHYQALINNSFINGNGYIGDYTALNFVNNGVVSANVNGGTLDVNSQVSGQVTNNGLMEASNGGTLALSHKIDNFNGTIAANGGTVVLKDASVNEGILVNNGGSLASAYGTNTLDNVTLAGGRLTLNPATNTVLKNFFINGGVVEIDGGSNDTYLNASGNVTLMGGGKVVLNTLAGPGAARIRGADHYHTLVNEDNTIEGNGYIGDYTALLFTNRSVVNANVDGKVLDVNSQVSGVVTNEGILEATNGGTLNLSNSIVNFRGTIGAYGGRVNLNNATVVGGRLVNAGGTLGTAFGNVTLEGVSLDTGSTYTMNNGTSTVLRTEFINGGVVNVNGGANDTYLNTSGALTLSGGGKIVLNTSAGPGAARIRGSDHYQVFENRDNTIEGNGTIGDFNALYFINGGTVNANVKGGVLDVNSQVSGVVTNYGTLEATNGGTLNLWNKIDNTFGTIKAVDGGIIAFRDATVTGGKINARGYNGGKAIAQGNVTFDGVELAGSTDFTVQNGSSTLLKNKITNGGSILLNSNGNDTILYVSGVTSLTGFGGVTLSSASSGAAARIRGTDHYQTLKNLDNMIHGSGSIGDLYALNFENSRLGSVTASRGVLDMNNQVSGIVTNRGTLGASYNGTLNLWYTINNQDGLILANEGLVNLRNATVTGGTLTNRRGTLGTAEGTVVLDGVTLSGGTYTLNKGTATILRNTFTNGGDVLIDGNGNESVLYVTGVTRLDGSGVIDLSSRNGGFARILANGHYQMLVNNGNTIQGSGTIGSYFVLNFLNGPGGTLWSNGSGMDVNSAGGSFVNQGTVRVAKGSVLNVMGDGNGFVQAQGASGTPFTQVDGTLIASRGVRIDAGVLEGSGVIQGNVVNGGTLHPGDSPGVLTIHGDLMQTSTGVLDFTLTGSAVPGTGYSQLFVSGTALLGGTLNATIDNLSTFSVGELFDLMTFGAAIGDFAHMTVNGQACDSVGIGSWSCRISSGVIAFSTAVQANAYSMVVTSVQAVPLPAALPMFGAALAGLGAMVRKRKRAAA